MAAHTGKRPLPELFSSISGHEEVGRFVVVDQRPLGRSPRSNAATYTGVWTAVRELFASLPMCRSKGWGPARFSFNVGDGRCAACEGQGAKEVEMHFLSDVWVPCDDCRGRRFNRETLGVHFKGKNIAEVLDLEVDVACEFFEHHPKIRPLLETMRDVGLGYLRLGQPANTLSGGEAQRLKLSRELAAKGERATLYVLDEPTTGLHFADIECLLSVLRRLVERGHSLIAVEHHLDVIRAADWVIDLGPEAGDRGGRVVAATDPGRVREMTTSLTGRCLKAEEAASKALAANRE
jgi:excinuclease ABC subunit A